MAKPAPLASEFLDPPKAFFLVCRAVFIATDLSKKRNELLNRAQAHLEVPPKHGMMVAKMAAIDAKKVAKKHAGPFRPEAILQQCYTFAFRGRQPSTDEKVLIHALGEFFELDPKEIRKLYKAAKKASGATAVPVEAPEALQSLDARSAEIQRTSRIAAVRPEDLEKPRGPEPLDYESLHDSEEALVLSTPGRADLEPPAPPPAPARPLPAEDPSESLPRGSPEAPESRPLEPKPAKPEAREEPPPPRETTPPPGAQPSPAKLPVWSSSPILFGFAIGMGWFLTTSPPKVSRPPPPTQATSQPVVPSLPPRPGPQPTGSLPEIWKGILLALETGKLDSIERSLKAAMRTAVDLETSQERHLWIGRLLFAEARQGMLEFRQAKNPDPMTQRRYRLQTEKLFRRSLKSLGLVEDSPEVLKTRDEVWTAKAAYHRSLGQDQEAQAALDQVGS